MSNPKVSIITPSFNMGKYLERTLMSVQSQDYGCIEHIVIDGGSTDGSVEVLEKYGSSLAYWVSESDGGQSNAINKGLRRATGEILTYLNADDVLDPHSVRHGVAAFQKDSSVDFVYGDYRLIDKNDVEVFRQLGIPYDEKVLVYGRSLFNQPSSFFRRSVVDKIGYYDESLDFCMDLEYWIRAAVSGVRFQYVPGLSAATRIHPDTKTSTIRHHLYSQHRQVLNRNGLLRFERIDSLNASLFKLLQIIYRSKGVIYRMIRNRDLRIFGARRAVLGLEE